MKHLLPAFLLLQSSLLTAQTESFTGRPPTNSGNYIPGHAELAKAVAALRGHADEDLLPDVEIYHKAAVWMQRFPKSSIRPST